MNFPPERCVIPMVLHRLHDIETRLRVIETAAERYPDYETQAKRVDHLEAALERLADSLGRPI